MYIYVLTNKINGYKYVGQTIREVEDRWQDHVRHANKPTQRNSAITKAIYEFGSQNFSVDILKVCRDKEELDKYEKIYIEELKSYDPSKGYNRTYGGGFNETRLMYYKGKLLTPFEAEVLRKENRNRRDLIIEKFQARIDGIEYKI